MKKAVIAILAVLMFCNTVFSQQQAYFVDGYHGGIYGHYPMWVTQFMVDKFNQYPEWRIGLEIEPETWDTVRLREPVAYNNFKSIVTDKRIEFTNPAYAQPYCYNISGESLIRQFEYGIKKIHQHFPDVTYTTYSAEEPCFTSALPQILRLFGFKYAVLKCPDTCWGGYTAAYGGELVNWIGPDGTSMLTVPRYACEELEDNSTWQTKAWNNSDSYLKSCFDYGIKNPVGMCYQDAGWKNGPWIGHGKNIKNNSIYVTWKDYIENISVGKTNDDYHFSQEEMRVNLMWGSQVLQKIAQEVRVSENRIVMAEKIAAMANIDNGYIFSQDRIDNAWRTLMMAQHHDSWIVPYNGLKRGRSWADEIALWTGNTNEISGNIIENAIHSYITKNGSNPDNVSYIRVYNTLGVKRTELVKINVPLSGIGKEVVIYNSKGKLLPSFFEQIGDSLCISFQAEVPSLGYATFRIVEQQPAITRSTPVIFDNKGNCILENGFYKIIIDSSRGGVIKSLISKKEKDKEYVDQASKFGLGELRGYFYEENRFYSTTGSPAKITVLEDNSFYKKVKIEGEIASHPFTQIITLTNGQKRIDFDLTVNWKNNVGIGEYKQGRNWRDNRRAFTDGRFKLNVMFPVGLSSAKLYKNAPFDVCESKYGNTFFSTWDSIKHNIILNWVDLVQKDGKCGFAVLSDHTTSYSYGEDFPLSLTAQYSGVGLWGVDYKITRPLKMKYAIIPHTANWDQAAISTESNKWNESLVASFYKEIALVDKSFFNIDETGYEVTAFKTENDNILIRLFNAEGDDSLKNLTFGFPVSSIEEVDLNGNTITKKTIKKNSISLSMPRFGIKTLLIKKLTKNKI
ncbi:glycoside hydrolase family 38 C-terminal domain-containing protein [Dysgonomonas hofstadii]|uniref:glycoside hydrolase family 38 C-terminal domain-containing protein n=1 Tax=Dysgonomonas hofstadii TaxID=637886 RepID=UPI00161747A8|nr:glycoside hydrolase family 38 C-terminal domain-containing protein [Dysgonomonas hofstadii]